MLGSSSGAAQATVGDKQRVETVEGCTESVGEVAPILLRPQVLDRGHCVAELQLVAGARGIELRPFFEPATVDDRRFRPDDRREQSFRQLEVRNAHVDDVCSSSLDRVARVEERATGLGAQLGPGCMSC